MALSFYAIAAPESRKKRLKNKLTRPRFLCYFLPAMIKTITKQTEEGTLTITIKADKYFSITGDLKCKDGGWAGGCIHDEILKAAPHLVPFVKIHLAALDGEPLHALENGWYWLAKAAGIPCRYEPDRPADECFELFIKHCRCLRVHAEEIRDSVKDTYEKIDAEHAKKHWRDYCEKMRPMWRSQAHLALQSLDKLQA